VLNPGLNANCEIDVGEVLCVAAPPSSSPSCTTSYTVVSGDYCAKIWEAFGLSEGEFRGLNPGLDAGCGIEVREVLCVG
jgi:hypothetical protein